MMYTYCVSSFVLVSESAQNITFLMIRSSTNLTTIAIAATTLLHIFKHLLQITRVNANLTVMLANRLLVIVMMCMELYLKCQ